MDAVQGRIKITETLNRADKPVSASTLAKKLPVSRQIIVSDAALLRAGGTEIEAPPPGLSGFAMLRTSTWHLFLLKSTSWLILRAQMCLPLPRKTSIFFTGST